MRIIIVAPRYDEATNYSSSWAKSLYNELKNKGYDVVYIGDREIGRHEVEHALLRGDIFIFYDHGSEGALWGSKTSAIISGINVHVLKDKICYTMACLSAKKLGKLACSKGCNVYWGYEKEFSFTTYGNKAFADFSSYGLKVFLENNDWKLAYNETVKYGKYLIAKLLLSGNILGAVLLENDIKVLRCYLKDEMPEPKTCSFVNRIKSFFKRLFN